MTDKALYEYMWKEYDRSGDLEYLKNYVSTVLGEYGDGNTHSGVNPHYKQITLRKPYLEMILEGLEKL
jgi:uncharacterized protein Usg